MKKIDKEVDRLSRKPVHVGMFSGGAASAYVAYLMVEMHGRENSRLFFTDTLWEDPDNYRFMDEVATYIGLEIDERIDGRTPEEVFRETRFLGNSRLAKCSSELKVRQTLIYIEELRNQGLEPILYFGIGPHEEHRRKNLEEFYEHYPVLPVETRFPLIDGNLKDINVKNIIETEWKIELPRMYELGFSHANCGGRCVRGGLAHYKHLYEVWPHKYQEQEEMENRLRAELGNVTILKRGGKPLTLEQFRKEIEASSYEGIEQQTDEEVPCVCVFA